MAFIAISTILWFLFFQSVGNSLLLLLRLRPQNPFLAVWLGFFATAVLCLGMALWMPVGSSAVRLTVMAAALPGILPTLRAWRALFSGQDSRIMFLCCVGVCLVLLAQSLVSVSMPMAYDTDLYHQQTVLWLKEYGIVPGLGNLHERLAQVSGWFTLAALMDWGPFHSRTAFVLPPLWLTAALLYFFYGAVHAPAVRQRLYLLCLLVLIGIHVYTAFYPNLYYDRPALLLYAIIIAEMLPLFPPRDDPEQMPRRLTVIALLLAASVLFKPITVVTAVFLLALLCLLVYRKTLRWTELPRILWLPAVTAVLWCVCNSMLSGYPVFPLTAFALPVDWRMRPEALTGYLHAVQGWARWPQAGYERALEAGLPYWFGPWLARNCADRVFLGGLLAPFCAGAVFWALALCRRNRRHGALFFFALCLAQCLYWFFQHPDYRFGLELFWVWAALGLTYAVREEWLTRLRWSRDALLVLALLACVALMKIVPALATEERRQSLHPLRLPPQHAPFPGVRQQTLHPGTPEAFTVFRPAPGEDRCGNSPLPCAPWPGEALFMRVPGDPEAGYCVRMERPGKPAETPPADTHGADAPHAP